MKASNRSDRNLPKQKKGLGDNAEGKAQKCSNQYPQKDKKRFVSIRQEVDAVKNGIIRKEEIAPGNKNYDAPNEKITEKLKGKVKTIAQKVVQKERKGREET